MRSDRWIPGREVFASSVQAGIQSGERSAVPTERELERHSLCCLYGFDRHRTTSRPFKDEPFRLLMKTPTTRIATMENQVTSTQTSRPETTHPSPPSRLGLVPDTDDNSRLRARVCVVKL